MKSLDVCDREEAEKAILKKKEEKERRERLLKQHIQEKQDNENVSLAYRQSGVVTTSEVTRPVVDCCVVT